MIRWLAPWLLVATGCETTSVVGYTSGGVTNLADCEQDSTLRRCTEGPCVVGDFMPAQRGSASLAVDDDHLFFLESPEILSRRRLDGGPPVELTASLYQSAYMAIDGEHVYWSEFGAVVRRVPKGGGEVEVAMSPTGHPTQIVLDEAHVYAVLPAEGLIAMAPKASGTMAQLGGQATPRSIALEGEHVYWVNQGTAGAGDGELVRARRGDLSTAEVLRDDLDGPLLLAVNQDAFVWVTAQTVVRLDRAGGEPEVVAEGLRMPKAIGLFGGTIYLAAESGLLVIPPGGDLEVLDVRSMTGLTLACSGVYANAWYADQIVRFGN